MPVIFIGHGSPENAIEKNEFSLRWQQLAKALPRPKSILSISAHWQTGSTLVTSMEKPKTIHDFYGFQKELYEVEYPANGSPALAKSVQGLSKDLKIQLDTAWGLDHGTWSVLVNMYPKADIPVVQLSLGDDLSLKDHFELGKQLSRLREEGVLIMGSGNVVHNLQMVDFDLDSYPWAVEFDNFVKKSLDSGDFEALVNYTNNKNHRMAHPTNEHYLPLLYVVGAAGKVKPKYINEKIMAGSLGMRCVICD